MPDDNRGGVWLTGEVTKEFGSYENFFPEVMRRLVTLN